MTFAYILSKQARPQDGEKTRRIVYTHIMKLKQGILKPGKRTS